MKQTFSGFLVVGCLSYAATCLAQGGRTAADNCPAFLQSYGLLSKAQKACDFPGYKNGMVAAAETCFERLPKPTAERAIREGLEMFDALEVQRGRKGVCDQVLASFPGYFGDPNFFDLERAARPLLSLIGNERFAEAYELARKLESEFKKRPKGQDQPLYATTLKALAISQAQLGKTEEAIQTLLKEIELEERLYGKESRALAETLNNLGLTYLNSRQPQLAEPLFRRALSMHERLSDAQTAAETKISLASALATSKRFAEAESLYHQALAAFGDRDRNSRVATIYENLAQMAVDREDYSAASEYFAKAIDIYAAAGMETKPSYAGLLLSIGDALLRTNNFPQAHTTLELALTTSRATLGDDHPKTAEIIDKISSAYFMNTLFNQTDSYKENLPRFLELRRQATSAALRSGRGNLSVDPTKAEAEANRDVFLKHLTGLGQAKILNAGDRTKLDEEAFQIAQLVNYSAAAVALRQMSARLSSQNERLGAIIRERQQKFEQKAALQASLSDAVARDDALRASALRKQQLDINSNLDRLSQVISRDFPSFADISEPRPLTVQQVQRLLKPDEALILFVPSTVFIHVFAVSQDSFQYSAIFNLAGEGQTVIDAKTIASFRKGLGSKATDSFDLRTSYRVYQKLFDTLDERIKSKLHYNFVPTGELTALPFHLLVTQEPASAVPEPSDYRKAPWIIRDHAIAVLPSVGSLEALRAIPGPSRPRKALVGFANPRFSKQVERVRIAGTRKPSYTEYWTGAGIDRNVLGRMLPPLPDSEDELREVARRVGASKDDLYLGERASERNVKSLSLKDYQIVYFATHGLVAGDVKGIGEPSLALTLPDKPDATDDGLLTASEVSQLSFNADWVVLSACNTIAGDRPGAEALSGLARAFFYAGARALLVTHWEVESEAATRLTTVAFRKLTEDKSLSRAEAVRQSMLELLQDNSSDGNSNPSYWGPFAVIGEGRLH